MSNTNTQGTTAQELALKRAIIALPVGDYDREQLTALLALLRPTPSAAPVCAECDGPMREHCEVGNCPMVVRQPSPATAEYTKGGGLSFEGDAGMPLATEETGSDRPAAPISCDHVGFYFCKKCGKDLTPDIPYADDAGSPTQFPRQENAPVAQPSPATAPQYSCYVVGCPGNHASKHMVCEAQPSPAAGDAVSISRETAERLYKAAIATADFSLMQLGGFDPPEVAPLKYNEAVQLSHDAKALKAALSTAERPHASPGER